ncbi:MAG: hypothetical protein K8H88_25045 [Sandaracinaceae bacterium]|nr:hypothetical protein [Sandaracinaceae bacterium]
MTRFTALLVFLALPSCSNDAEPHVSAEMLLADPAAFEGRTVHLDGPFRHDVYCNGAACTSTPCNNCRGAIGIGETFETRIALVPGEGWPYAQRANGYLPQPSCYDDYCQDVALGCTGNDVELVCAPAVPSRILEAHGRLETVDGFRRFVVDELVLDESAPREESITPGLYPGVASTRMVEAAE